MIWCWDFQLVDQNTSEASFMSTNFQLVRVEAVNAGMITNEVMDHVLILFLNS